MYLLTLWEGSQGQDYQQWALDASEIIWPHAHWTRRNVRSNPRRECPCCNNSPVRTVHAEQQVTHTIRTWLHFVTLRVA